MKQQELIPHLFRTEFSKITAVLCRHFGTAHLDLAEDVAGETFLAALETWPRKGIPENPVAWLYTVAKNKAANHFARLHTFQFRITQALQHTAQITEEIDLSEQNITDSQLQMLFAICHPGVAPEAQIGLALRILCGFGIDEIATALLSNKEAINKRLFRAREKLREDKIPIALPPLSAITDRLNTVLTTLYLLFNEGYYSESQNSVLREDLCHEAMRLTGLLTQHPLTDQPAVKALLALMCFHASRFPARKKDNGELVLYHQQDETLWDQALISRGAGLLHQAATGNTLSRYHIEASIAWWHTVKDDTPEKWGHVLRLYDHLLAVAWSPVAALNRTFALSKVEGKQAAIAAAEALALHNNHYYHTLLGELCKDIDPARSRTSLERAFLLAKTEADKKAIAALMTG